MTAIFPTREAALIAFGRDVAEGMVWTFPAGAPVPRWLMRPENCAVAFAWPVAVIAGEEGWELSPTRPMPEDGRFLAVTVIDPARDADFHPTRPVTMSRQVRPELAPTLH